MGRSRDIADMLGKTELANTNNEALITTFDAVDSAYVSANSTPALVFYSTLDSLPVSGLSVGQQAYVSANSRLYISDGSGWYNKALITLSPTMTLSPSGTITLANDGVTTSTVTIVANDSDTPGSGLTYSVESDGNMLGRAVISQDSSVFTIRPLSSDSGATDGTFTLTFKTSDGVNLAFDSADFSLTFVTAVDSSAETVMLLKATGNSATNAAITYQNSSDVSTGFTEAGNPQASTLSPYRSGGYSTNFDGSGDAIEVSQTGFPAIGTSDFTIEAWVYANSLASNMAIFDGRPSGTSGGNYITLQWHASTYGMGFYSAGWRITSPTNTLTANTWHHIALSRSGNSTKLFVDGTQVGSTYSDTTSYLYGRNYIGGLYNNTNTWWNGYMRDFRVSIGTARYTSNFTPSTEALTADVNTDVLVCHLPYFKDGSTNDATLTISGNTKTVPFGPYDYLAWVADDHGGSVYFDGSGDYIDATVGTAPGTGDFTYEGWFRADDAATGDAQYIFDTSNDGFGTGGLSLYVGTGGEFGAWAENGGVAISYVGFTRIYWDETWHHFAWVRSGSTMNMYIDGKLASGPHTYTRNLYSTDFRLGYNGRTTPTQPFTGSIADFRYTRSAVYTSAFTPPSAPLGHITNTELLMNNNSDANVYDVSASKNFDLVGGTVTNNSTRKFTTSSSIYFPGPSSGVDGITITDPSGPMSKDQFLTSDFTIEFWVYPTGWFNNDIFMCYDAGGGNTGSFNLYNSSGIKFYADNDTDTSWDLVSAASVFSTWTNSWKHFAMTYDASAQTVKIYLDGTEEYSVGSITGWENGGSLGDYNTLAINQGTNDTNKGAFTGYIQDVRVSKSVRYTAAFTPPTAEFEL